VCVCVIYEPQQGGRLGLSWTFEPQKEKYNSTV
jgi:hypothetical protein